MIVIKGLSNCFNGNPEPLALNDPEEEKEEQESK